MPGPGGPRGARPWSPRSATGTSTRPTVDRKVLRLLLLAASGSGALDGYPPATARPVAVEDGVAFAREAAVAGAVLRAQQPADACPVAAVDALGSVAVIGHNARFARTQGGGSATVLPEHVGHRRWTASARRCPTRR